MNGWQRWKQAPQTLWFRRALFQIHLWLGIGLGLYVLMISVTGSAVVLRPQFSQWFIPSQVASTEGEPLTGEVLEARVAAVYPDYDITLVAVSTLRGRAAYVAMEKDGVEQTRFFDHYAGEDLGDTFPWQMQVMEWLVDLHDELLMGRQGRRLTSMIGGTLFTVMLLSGLILWWPGRARWSEALWFSRGGKRSLMWQLHVVLGFWGMFLMLAWGISSLYFAFPGVFDMVIDALDDELYDSNRPDAFLQLLIRTHFGRFGPLWVRITWVVLGLLPALLFVTGLVLWWRRVVKRKWLARGPGEKAPARQPVEP